MTAVAVDLHHTAATRLRAVGQRYTPNRRALVDILSAAAQPLSIPDVLQAGPLLPQSSVYRNLAVLEQARVVRRIVASDEFARYELTEDLTGHHHHLICSNCGSVVSDRTGFAAISHRLDLVGLCQACA